MRSGAKVGLLATFLAAAVGAVLWIVRDAAPSIDEGTPLPAPATAAPPSAPKERAAPQPRHTPKTNAPKEADDDAKPAAAKTSSGVKIVGSVVETDEKTPVAGAIVRARRPDGTIVETKSAADGTFALALGARPRDESLAVGITASAGVGRAAFLSYEFLDDAPDEDDVGPLVIEKAAPIVARVVDAAGPVAGAQVALGTFFGTVFSSATTDAKGVARLDGAPAADAWLFAFAKGRGRARGEVPETRDPKTPLVLTLTKRAVVATVVRTPPDEPLAGERVVARIVTDVEGQRFFTAFVPPQVLAPTAADGTTTIDDVALEDALELRCGVASRAEPPWRAPRRPANAVVVDGRAVAPRIEFDAGRAIRWRIAATGETTPPGEGALVALKPALTGVLPPGPTHLKVENGDLVGEGFGPGAVSALAVADDGAVASLHVDSNLERGLDAVFRRPRRVDFRISEEGGGPIAGASVLLKTDDGRQRPIAEGVSTDAEGRAHFDGLDPALGRLAAFVALGADVRRIGAADVTNGDATVEGMLPRARTVTLRVTTEGERKLPAGCKAMVDNQWIDSPETDDAAAEIRVTARPHAANGQLGITLRADGFRDVFVAAPAGKDVADAAFDKGVAILADVRTSGTSWNPQVWLERWSEAESGFRIASSVLGARRDEEGLYHVERQPPGRYRMTEGTTGATSAVVDLALGDAPARLLIDLARAGFVAGRVLGPDDKPVANAWILLADPADDAPPATNPLQVRQTTNADGSVARAVRLPMLVRASTDAAGAFRVVVPGDRAIRLYARHAWMKPAPAQDFADVREPKDGVVLRLLEGPCVEFALPTDFGRDVPMRMPQVQLFRGPAAGEPVAQLSFAPIMQLAPGQRFRAGGFEPGRYTLWIEVGGGAPLVLSDVDLKDGVNDLGELRPPRGGSVRVRVTTPAGGAPQTTAVFVVRLDPPAYMRGATSRDSEIVVAGLGPGRFEVRVSQTGGPRDDSFKRTIDLDGEREVVVEYASK